MPRFVLNGESADCPVGLTILQALHRAGQDVPHLCTDPRISPIGACRLCLVHIEGHPAAVSSCNTPVTDGMVIQTHTPGLEQSRKTILQLLAGQYPVGAPANSPAAPFHKYLQQYGLADKCTGQRDPARIDDSHPYIRVDMSQCIDCFRCVRICDELQGQNVWRILNRGDQTRIVPDKGGNLRESSCVSCGACVDTCPTGALSDKSLFPLQVLGEKNWPRNKTTRTTCPYCGVGCEMNVHSLQGKIVGVTPAEDAPVNKGHLCVKGRYAWGYNHAPDRVTQPMLKRNGRWEPASWHEAIEFVADKLRAIRDASGPDSIGILGSARATNEDNYLTQKFARVVIGTNSVDCCARVCHAPSAAGMKMTLGTGAATNCFDDIEKAGLIMILGANPTENHPIVGARFKQAVLKGAKLIVVDPRRIELAEYADIHLPIRPGTNIPLIHAIAHVIIEEQLLDAGFIANRVGDFESFRQFVRDWTPQRAAPICGVDADLIRRAARLYASTNPAMCFHGLGLAEHSQGTETVACLVNLALLTGNLGKPGAGINPLRGQNNVQGAAHMGCEPAGLTGGIPIREGRALFEKVWQTTLPTKRGLRLPPMLDAAADGNLKAMWAIGYDILLSSPDASHTRNALAKLDLLILQDMFLNELADFAHVFLPAASSFEKDGTFMNSERRIQRVRKVVDPPGECRADWQIIQEIAQAMGHAAHFNFSSPRQIWDEIRAVWPDGSGITYDRIDQAGLQWPCPDENHPGTPILHTQSFPIGPRAPLQRIDFRPTSESIDDQFPMLLITGRRLYQFNAATMTARTPNATLQPEDLLDISPADARQLDIQDGDLLQIRSRYGQTRLKARITEEVIAGQLFTTFHTPTVFINELTSPLRDNHTDTPEYKVVAVHIEKSQAV